MAFCVTDKEGGSEGEGVPRSPLLPSPFLCRASPVAQRQESPPVIQETQVRSPGQEDPLEKEMATHSSSLAWRIPWVEEPGRLQSMGSQRVGHKLATEQQHFPVPPLTKCLHFYP